MAACESPPRAVRRLGVGLLAILFIAAWACGREEAEAPSPEEAPAPAAEPEKPAAPLPRSTSSIEVAGQRVTLRSNGAARTVLLVELAQKAGFELELGRGLDPEPLVLELRDVDVNQALAALLAGTDYGVFYAFDPATGGHVLARVSVGQEPRFTAAATRRPPAESGEMGREAEPRGSEASTELPPAEGQPTREELMDRLDTPDPELRAQAVAGIEPAGAGLSVLIDVLSKDPDPSVRAAAAAAIGDTDVYLAIGALLDALHDPDPQVVVTALDALEFAGDESVIPQVEPLLENPDPAVREAAAEAIEMLE
jgi:hypothetical protein